MFYRGARPSPNPVIASASEVFANLRQHISKAADLFGASSTTVAQPSSVKWNLAIDTPAGAQPLRVTSDEVGFGLAADVKELSWRASNSGEFSRITGSAGIDGSLKIHDGQLVADAYLPLQLTAAGAGGMPVHINLNLPVLIAFNDSLKSADSSSRLWDSDHYLDFWSRYRPGAAGRGVLPLINRPRWVTGALSLREIVAPLQLLRINVGHAGRFSIHAPFSARLLNGTASGILDGALDWPQGEASLDSRLHLSFRNLQAGALGLDSSNGHLPLLEHELDGDIALSTHAWPIRKDTFEGLSYGSIPGLDRISLGVDVRTSSRGRTLPGFFQLRSGAQVRTLNEILDRVIEDIQLKSPPSSIFFQNLALKLDVDRGKVQTDQPWLRLEGLRILSSDDLHVEGSIRLHGARNGETLDIRDLLSTFQILRPDN
jgi:hypothetical protein